jgi:ribosome-associated protein
MPSLALPIGSISLERSSPFRACPSNRPIYDAARQPSAAGGPTYVIQQSATEPVTNLMTSVQPLPSDAGVTPNPASATVAAEPGSLLDLVLRSLDDDQAQEVVTIPLEGKSSVADHMVIASGRSTRQVASMAQKLAERIKHGGFGRVRIEGLPAADWVLIDAGDIVVHVFRPEVRSFYNLERMWAFGDQGAA